jgi:hypothetical protein
MHPGETDRRDILILIGRALYGAGGWQTALARELGPLHPAGGSEPIDDRMIRQWICGIRAIPDWVGPALAQLCDERCRELTAAGDATTRW